MIVIGVGNAFRSDDAAGLVAARRLRERVPAGTRVLELEGDLSALLEAWKGAESVVLIDAMAPGAAPGTVLRFEARDAPPAARSFRGSTHAFGIVEALELARALGQLPPREVVYGIEGKSFDAGEGLTPEVAAAVGQVIEMVLAEPMASFCAPKPSALARPCALITSACASPVCLVNDAGPSDTPFPRSSSAAGTTRATGTRY